MKKQGFAPKTARKWAVVLALGCVQTMEGVAAAEEAPTNADDCVSFENHLGDKQVSIHVQNSCDLKLSCTLRYKVRCSASDGSSSQSSSKQEAFKLGSKGSRELSLSAQDCKQNWDIDQIEWECS